MCSCVRACVCRREREIANGYNGPLDIFIISYLLYTQPSELPSGEEFVMIEAPNSIPCDVQSVNFHFWCVCFCKLQKTNFRKKMHYCPKLTTFFHSKDQNQHCLYLIFLWEALSTGGCKTKCQAVIVVRDIVLFTQEFRSYY